MKIVIIGAGFAGIRLARKLMKEKRFEITLIDKNNNHQFQPLFYQVATAGLDPSNISFPLRKIFQNAKNVKIRLAEVTSIDDDKKVIQTSVGEIYYDKLIIATGATTNFFGNEELATHALGMKSTTEALEIRYKLLENIEKALTAKSQAEKQAYLNIVIVGGGPTGVELSGAIADLKRFVLPKDYPEINFEDMKIYLIENSAEILDNMSTKSSLNGKKYLLKLGVTILNNTRVINYDGEQVFLGNETTISSKLLIWAAGIAGNTIDGISFNKQRGNRIKVNSKCVIEGISNMYAIGDIAAEITEKYPNGHPQVAPVAIQQADMVAKNLINRFNGVAEEHLSNFKYKDQGSMATVGRNLAVVDVPFPKMFIGGFLAWLIWMGLHLMLILGVKNRFFVFLNWLYSYFTYDQNLRLIFKENSVKHK